MAMAASGAQQQDLASAVGFDRVCEEKGVGEQWWGVDGQRPADAGVESDGGTDSSADENGDVSDGELTEVRKLVLLTEL